VSKPMPQATAGFVHPLTSLVKVWNTYRAVLRWARTARVIMLTKKNTIWQKVAAIWIGLSSRLNHKFPRKGRIVIAHISSVTCHRCRR
jgi:hypothetical protein